MKIFNFENGKEKVYVQMNDIAYLNSGDRPIPASIYMKVFIGVMTKTDSNRMNFISFDEPHEIEFFRNIDFILDYNDYRKMSLKELEAKKQKFIEQYKEKAKIVRSMTEKEIKQNQGLWRELE